MAGSVLLDGQERGHADALGEELAQAMAGALGRDHDDIHCGRRNDKLVVNIKSVGKHQGLARSEVWGDCLLVYLRLNGIRDKYDDHVGTLGGFRRIIDFEACVFCLGARRIAHALGNNHLHSAVAQIQRVRVSLATVADNGHGLPRQILQIAIFLIVNFSHWSRVLFVYWICKQELYTKSRSQE